MSDEIKTVKYITDPVINGGCYVHRKTGEEAMIMGVERNDRAGVLGNLYTQTRGALPTLVVENSISMQEWELVRVGSSTAAGKLTSAHRKQFKLAEEAA